MAGVVAPGDVVCPCGPHTWMVFVDVGFVVGDVDRHLERPFIGVSQNPKPLSARSIEQCRRGLVWLWREIPLRWSALHSEAHFGRIAKQACGAPRERACGAVWTGFAEPQFVRRRRRDRGFVIRRRHGWTRCRRRCGARILCWRRGKQR